jgi:predicted metalloendopeptidase
MLKGNEVFHSVNGKRQILIADDEMINREILGEMLKDDYEILFAEDGIKIRSQLAESVLRAASSMQDSAENGMHRIDPESVAVMLDPDEEDSFRRYVSSVQIGPDDEAFYRETKASYMINNYKLEKSELMNELSIAEKTGREDEIEEIAGRLIRLDKLIDNINQTMEENNA